MTKPLAEGEKWVWYCNADEDDALCCHVSDPNAWLKQTCKSCPDSMRKRVVIGSKQDPEAILKETLDWESQFLHDQMVQFYEDRLKEERAPDQMKPCSYCNGQGTLDESDFDAGRTCPKCDGVGVDCGD